MNIETNPFLTLIMQHVRKDRPPLSLDQPYFTRVEQVPAGNYVEVWFLTRGCSWDRSGGCTMCNYGAGPALAPRQTISSISRALDEISIEPNELMVSPSGGMWDEREVSASVRLATYDLVSKVKPGRFFVETRAETVTPDRVEEFRAAFPALPLAVEVGLESSSDPVLRFCVNKGTGVEGFRCASDQLKPLGIQLYANVSLGTAFLTPEEAVHDAVTSTRWALRNGADRVVVFPLHIKPYTLLDVLAQHGHYEAVSLWDLVEMLVQLGPAYSSKVEIAWYKSYYDTPKKIRRSPSGCQACSPMLLSALDRYRATQDFGHIQSLSDNRCKCSRTMNGHSVSGEDIGARILTSYSFLANTLGLERQWQGVKDRYETSVRGAFSTYR